MEAERRGVGKGKNKRSADQEQNPMDKMHRCDSEQGRSRKLTKVLIYDESLNNQHRSTHKFSKRWFGPYMVVQGNDKATCHLTELDGTMLATSIAM